jgi:DNA-binding MarR family transcriptional regulator
MHSVLPSLAADLDARLIAIWRAVGRVDRHDLSRTAASVLGTLRDRGPQRVTALAASEAVAQPSMTQLVGRLERAGLVERRHDPLDARAVLVAITTGGLERLLGIRAARAEAMEARLAALDPEDRAALAAAIPVLDKLIEGGPTR